MYAKDSKCKHKRMTPTPHVVILKTTSSHQLGFSCQAELLHRCLTTAPCDCTLPTRAVLFYIGGSSSRESLNTFVLLTLSRLPLSYLHGMYRTICCYNLWQRFVVAVSICGWQWLLAELGSERKSGFGIKEGGYCDSPLAVLLVTVQFHVKYQIKPYGFDFPVGVLPCIFVSSQIVKIHILCLTS